MKLCHEDPVLYNTTAQYSFGCLVSLSFTTVLSSFPRCSWVFPTFSCLGGSICRPVSQGWLADSSKVYNLAPFLSLHLGLAKFLISFLHWTWSLTIRFSKIGCRHLFRKGCHWLGSDRQRKRRRLVGFFLVDCHVKTSLPHYIAVLLSHWHKNHTKFCLQRTDA